MAGTVYLASPASQVQAAAVCQMPVLLSFALYSKWLDQYQPSFSRILVDSGAFSVMNSGEVVDLQAYKDFASRFEDTVDAIAGLDDIEGDWRKSLKNYEVLGFPTIHDTDPFEILPDLIDIARSRGGWLGIGLLPPRGRKEEFVRKVCDSVPDDIHIHGWALREYWYIRRLDSVDSTNWWRDAMSLRKDLPWLTYFETLELVVKRYQREARIFKKAMKGFSL